MLHVFTGVWLQCLKSVTVEDATRQGIPYTYKRKIEARSHNHSCRGRAICTAYSDSVSVALVIQRATRMRRVIASSVACPALLYFSTLSHKRHDFRKRLIENKMCFDFSTTTVWNICHYKKKWGKYYHKCIQVKYGTRYSCRVLMALEISRQIFEKKKKKNKYSDIKFKENPSSTSSVVPWRWKDRRTETTNLIDAFHNFTNALKYRNTEQVINTRKLVHK